MLWEVSDSLMPSAAGSRIRPVDPVPDPALLADRILRGSEYDFGSLQGTPTLILDRPRRRGVRVMAARTTALPDEAVDAILAWRLGQYVLTGFYESKIVTEARM